MTPQHSNQETLFSQSRYPNQRRNSNQDTPTKENPKRLPTKTTETHPEFTARKDSIQSKIWFIRVLSSTSHLEASFLKSVFGILSVVLPHPEFAKTKSRNPLRDSFSLFPPASEKYPPHSPSDPLLPGSYLKPEDSFLGTFELKFSGELVKRKNGGFETNLAANQENTFKRAILNQPSKVTSDSPNLGQNRLIASQ